MLGSGRGEVPFGLDCLLGRVYVFIGQPERWVELCRAQLARGRDTHALTRGCLVAALTAAGCLDDAVAAATGLIDAAEDTHNPQALAYALLAYGTAWRAADPHRALAALRRGLLIARESGNRANESYLAQVLARLEAEHGDPLAALDYLTLSIRNIHDSGNTATIRVPLGVLAALLDRLGRAEPAATIAGFAPSPITKVTQPELDNAIAHLRDVLGDQVYESLARKGETMTAAEMVSYAYDQIDQARATLTRPASPSAAETV